MRLFVADAAVPNAVEQHRNRCLQVDDQVGARALDIQTAVNLVVEAQFVGVQGGFREHAVLFDQEVGHQHGADQVVVGKPRNLSGAMQQKIQLGRQGVAAPLTVKAVQERVFGGGFEQQRAPEGVSQASRERGLADPDGPFDGNEIELGAVGVRCRGLLVGHGGLRCRNGPA